MLKLLLITVVREDEKRNRNGRSKAFFHIFIVGGVFWVKGGGPSGTLAGYAYALQVITKLLYLCWLLQTSSKFDGEEVKTKNISILKRVRIRYKHCATVVFWQYGNTINQATKNILRKLKFLQKNACS